MEILTNLYLSENQQVIYYVSKPIVWYFKTIGFVVQNRLF